MIMNKSQVVDLVKDPVSVGSLTRSTTATRHGVTLMECIFAIGVILTGLVGLAALIPVASQNARETLEIDRSITESTSAAAVGSVQSFNNLDSLVFFDKSVEGSDTFTPGGYLPSDQMRTLAVKLSLTAKLESPGYVHMPAASGLTSGICIDPFGLPDLAMLSSAPADYVNNPNALSPFTAHNTGDSAFNYSRFPYFNERYNVLSPPNGAIGTNAGPNASTLTRAWPMSPRMYRATLRSPLYPSTPVMRRFQLMPSPITNRIFGGGGGLSKVAGAHRDQPNGVQTERSFVGTNLVDTGRDPASDYTWFATLVPAFDGGDSFRQSIVVVRKRVAPVPRRNGDPTALSRAAYTINDADDNPTAERIAWIDPSSVIGFNGGAGGEVTVYGSQAISNDIESDSWVMLSRQPHGYLTGPPRLRADGVPGVPRPAVHRWFRVLSVGEAVTPADLTMSSWPAGNQAVWSRRVSLAGPDWAFQDESAGTNISPIDDTFMTIVEGAVSVIESEVRLN